MTTHAAELLEAVRGFLGDEVIPALEGHAAFEARIARNALGIVARELTLGPSIAALDGEARGWLDGPEAEAEAPVALAAALRRGERRADGPVRDYLRRRTLLQLAIDNPRYSSLAEAKARWPGLVPDALREEGA